MTRGTPADTRQGRCMALWCDGCDGCDWCVLTGLVRAKSFLRAQVASILALNPLMEAADKRAFVRRFLKNAARPEEESRRLLDTGM